MKIGEHGSGGSGGGHSGQNATPEERRRRFAARHRPGDIVRGRVLKAEGKELTWIGFEGTELLVPALAGCPPGSLAVFRIEAVAPEIVLKPLGPAPGSPAALAAAGARFIAARAAFEAGLEAAGERDEAVADAFMAALAEVNASLPRGAALTCPYERLPGARELECLTREAGPHEPRRAELGCRLPGPNRVRASFVAGEGRGAFRLRAEHPEAAGALAAHLAEPGGNPLGLALECLGVSPLPAGVPGVLAEMLRATKGIGRDRMV
jgi:hypothetical protein